MVFRTVKQELQGFRDGLQRALLLFLTLKSARQVRTAKQEIWNSNDGQLNAENSLSLLQSRAIKVLVIVH